VVLDSAAGAVRAALRTLGGLEQDIVRSSPIEEPLHDAVAAIHRAADSMDRHIEILEGLAASLPALTDAVTRLADQVTEAMKMMAPLEHAEREAAGVRRLFRRHHDSA
jgi:hypothetical protein